MDWVVGHRPTPPPTARDPTTTESERAERERGEGREGRGGREAKGRERGEERRGRKGAGRREAERERAGEERGRFPTSIVHKMTKQLPSKRNSFTQFVPFGLASARASATSAGARLRR